MTEPTDFDTVVRRIAERVCLTLLDIHPQQLVHEFDGETDRDIDGLELGGSG